MKAMNIVANASNKNLLQRAESAVIEDDIISSMQNLANEFKDKIVFSTSLGAEDQVITHIIRSYQIPIRIFTLDTGRLYEETYKTLQRTNEYYGMNIEVFFPDTHKVQELVTKKGAFSFYESIENRKECCYIRKVEPLKRAIAEMECWITGIRAEQSENRLEMTTLEWDESNQIVKYHPLLKWTEAEVWNFIRKNHIPYNVLHDKGFPSIGCAPCTRAIKPGEDFRAGRWWWEDKSKKECGLHER
ncbi:MAG: phosphoadenylyl-sulfate reductase [Cytophagales bacterium]|nr:phosphoadenylyl-sulfate reductase [Cytophagales bacterium]MDW8383455.1 phosphoadenylyl-sulfate reductase [Flammeovirgaceae bacterium]